MKLHQSGNKIIVTELNPISDATKDIVFLVFHKDNPVRPREASVINGVYRVDGHYIPSEDLIGWLPMPFYEPSAKSPEDRYEKLRKLNPAQFSELHERNLSGENFDEMVDAL